VLHVVTLAVWGLFELGLRVRESLQGRGRTGRDRFTRVLIALSIGLAVGVSAPLPARLPSALRTAGVAVMWIGLALRVWAVATLGRAFRTTVEVDPDQAVVTAGPYARIRHPSYTGLLLVVAGFGLAERDWLALALCGLLPLPAVLWRITVEEAELTHVLGEPYRRYAARTKRLIPGVW
jgi:protein-S-isoprenylcysteine O-methyltransferase Ste14